MPSLPNREILRAILSNPTAVRAERQRRRVRLGTDRDLLAFVEETFGVHIPAVACCPGHVAPAQAFCDAYFNRASVAVWKASRGFGGKSTLLALLALTEAITLQADVTVLGGSAQQSERVLEVMTRLWQAPHAPSHLLASPPAVRRTRFVWGNTITALPASQTAVRGPHPQRLRIDEADEMLLAVLDAAHGQPMDRAGVQAQTVISSTHQHPDGTMTAVLQRAAARGWPVYQWCYRDTLEPHGWLTQAQVDRKRAEVPEQTWLSEYDLQEPSAEGRAIDSEAVDWTFDPQRGTGGAAQLDQGWEGEAPADAAEAYYAHGADWGQAIDYTVIATLRCDVRPLPLVAASRSHRRPWPVMIGVLNDRMARYPGVAAHDHTGGGRVVGEYVTAPILDVDMVGQRRRDLFIDYFAAIERHEITAPRVDPFYTEHRFCRVDDVFGSGHPPDTVVAMALAYHAFREARAPGDYGITL